MGHVIHPIMASLDGYIEGPDKDIDCFYLQYRRAAQTQ
jgi:hypothetical protein